MTDLRRGNKLTALIRGDVTCDATRSAADEAADCLSRVDTQLLPSFFIVGPPRTGSSWLHEILRSYTLLPGPSKETRFFDTYFHRGLKWYLAHYKASSGKQPVGEVAPTYFASASARQRIARVVRDAKIVCVFRNPVERVLSLYKLKRAYGMIPWSLEEALERDPELTESSRYAANLELWQQSFGASNVLACIYDDLREDPQSFVDVLADFVGIARFTLAASQRGRVHDSESMTHPRNYYGTRGAVMLAGWFKSRQLDRLVIAVKASPLRRLVLGGGQPFSQPSTDVLMRLYEKFMPEVEELETLLNRDLSSWKIQTVIKR
jgi:hypothetical protein